jgi:hypothetical protein
MQAIKAKKRQIFYKSDFPFSCSLHLGSHCQDIIKWHSLKALEFWIAIKQMHIVKSLYIIEVIDCIYLIELSVVSTLMFRCRIRVV